MYCGEFKSSSAQLCQLFWKFKKRPGMRISRKNFENELQRELFPDFLRNNWFPEKLNFDCLFLLLMGACIANILKNIYTPYLSMVFVKFI